MKTARVYLRVSTHEQDLERQEHIVQQAKENGFYISGVYREKASGARPDRPELLRLIDDLQPGDVVIAEQMDRISRLPLPEATKLIESIRDKGATLAIPGVVDLSELSSATDGVSRIVLESVQEMLLKLALQMAHDDYTQRRERQKQGIEKAKQEGKYSGRKPDKNNHARIVELRKSGVSIDKTAKILGCSASQVKLIWARHNKKKKGEETPPKINQN